MPTPKFILSIAAFLVCATIFSNVNAAEQPNILFCIADDWGWPHAGAYGDEVVKTPTFDRLAKEGVLFENAFVASPSCTPSRNAILTGQSIWRLGSGCNLYGELPQENPVYPHLLADAGYAMGHSGKSYGPGPQTWKVHPAGPRFANFNAFLKEVPEGKPFVYWLGTGDPHRPYKLHSGKAAGMDLSKVQMFEHYPDHEVVRGDVADYYVEVQRFDSLVASAIAELEKRGELDNTIVVMTGDHGMPFPRCKGNLYDCGSRVPLAIRWPAGIKTSGRKVEDLVGLWELAPTFLAAAGLAVPEQMNGVSLLPVMKSDKSGWIEPAREEIIFGRERHTVCQEDTNCGYPSRAIRTKDYLYILNHEPDRWPAGTPDVDKAFEHKRGNSITRGWLGDCDNGPTKSFIVANKDLDAAHAKFYDLSFGKRPAEELYVLANDPEQLTNVAGEKKFADVQAQLSSRLTELLKESGDPRADSGGEEMDRPPYGGGVPGYVGDAAIEKYRLEK
jgi:N-sulfoglucosamine sulfohydrolase